MVREIDFNGHFRDMQVYQKIRQRLKV